MALSPAEKQRRYRARLRERLDRADNSLTVDELAMMRESWERSIEEQRQSLSQAHRENRELRAEIGQLQAELERLKEHSA